MSDFLADLDIQTIGVVALSLVLGFLMVWTILSARAKERVNEEERKAGPPAADETSGPSDRSEG
jgi:hypothetical protein